MNWDDSKYFLAVARAGQMLGAATRLGVSQAKLSRRINALEQALDCKLFDRSTGGCELTADGNALLEIAERIEGEFLNAQSTLKGSESNVSGTLRVGAPDGFGIAFLSPRLHKLSERFPDLQIQLVPAPRSFSLSQREADIAVMVGRPEKGRLRARKLTDYSLGLYASRGYLERMGTPEQLSDLFDHQLVGYVEDLIFTPELNYTTEILRGWHSGIEISSVLGQFEAVRSGAGIGVLHDFMAAPCPDVIRLFPQKTLLRSYHTVWHESMKNTKRIAIFAQFLNDLVQAERKIFTYQS